MAAVSGCAAAASAAGRGSHQPGGERAARRRQGGADAAAHPGGLRPAAGGQPQSRPALSGGAGGGPPPSRRPHRPGPAEQARAGGGAGGKLGQALEPQDLETALALSSQLRRLPGAPPWSLLRHAHLLRQLGRLQEALAVLEAPVAAPALQAHVLKNRGEIHRDLGDLPASLASLQDAVALDPHCPDHAIALGFLHAEVGAFDQGLELLHEAERLISDPDSPAERWLRLLQVYLLHRRGEYDTALAIAQGLTGDSALGFEARLQVAGLLIRLGDAKAEGAWRRLSPGRAAAGARALRLRVDWLLSQLPHPGGAAAAASRCSATSPSTWPSPSRPVCCRCCCWICRRPGSSTCGCARRRWPAATSPCSGSPGPGCTAVSTRSSTPTALAGHPPAGAATAPTAARAPLAALLAEESESHAAAFSLVLAARQAGPSGALGRPAAPAAAPSPASGPPLIPRRILQFWQGEDLPDSVAVAASSWTQANPGYEHRIWRDADASGFIAERAPERVRQAFAKAASPLLRADLLRLAWLHLEGGVVASLNTRCRHSLDPLLSPGIDGVLYQQRLGFLGTDFMAACPGQPLIAAMLDLACFLVLGEQGSNPWFLSGPGMQTLCFARYYREGLADLSAPPPPGLRLLRESQLSQRVSLDLQWPVRISGSAWHDPAEQLQGQGQVFNRSRRRTPRRFPR